MFDKLFKIHLINVYTALGLQPPLELTAELKEPRPPDIKGTDMIFTPTIDGKVTRADEWNTSSTYYLQDNLLKNISIGANTQYIYIRLDVSNINSLIQNTDIDIALYFSGKNPYTNPYGMNVPASSFVPFSGKEMVGFPIKWRVKLLFDTITENKDLRFTIFRSLGNDRWVYSSSYPNAKIDEIIEIAIPLSALELSQRDIVAFSILKTVYVNSLWQPAQYVAGYLPMVLKIPEDMYREYILNITDKKEDNIFEIVEVTNDDTGDGDYEYPTSSEMAPNDGLFDITRLKIYNTTSELVFEFKFREMGLVQNGKPMWDPPYKFGMQMINIYIDTDRINGSGNLKMLEGANAEVTPEFAWEIAVSARGWEVYAMVNTEKVTSGVSADTDWNESSKTWDDNIVNVRISTALFDKDFRKYGYVIVVGSQDEYGPGKWRTVNKVKERWRFGGGTDTIYDPNIIDMITPSGVSQSSLLGSYDVIGQKFASIPGITLPPRDETNETPQPSPDKKNETENVSAITIFDPIAQNLPYIIIPLTLGILVVIMFVVEKILTKKQRKIHADEFIKAAKEREFTDKELLILAKEKYILGEIDENTMKEIERKV